MMAEISQACDDYDFVRTGAAAGLGAGALLAPDAAQAQASAEDVDAATGHDSTRTEANNMLPEVNARGAQVAWSACGATAALVPGYSPVSCSSGRTVTFGNIRSFRPGMAACIASLLACCWAACMLDMRAKNQ